MQITGVHVKRQATGHATERIHNATGLGRNVYVHHHLVVARAQIGRAELGQARHAAVEMPFGAAGADTRGGVEQRAQAGPYRVHVIGARLLVKLELQLCQLLGMLAGQVYRLGEIAVQPVQGPYVFVRVPVGVSRGRGRQPGQARAEYRCHPAIGINAAAAEHFEILLGLACAGFRIGEGIGQAGAVQRVLLEAIHGLGWADADHVVDGRRDVVDMVKLSAHLLVGLDALGPGDRHRHAGATKITRHQLGALERAFAGPGPAGVVHVGDLRAAQRLQAAILLFQNFYLLRDRYRYAADGQNLVDGSARAFRRRAVVGQHVKDQRVVA